MTQRLRRDNAVTWLLAAWPLLVGITIAAANERFTSRSWRFASGVPGGYNTWAGVLMACGFLMLLALILNRQRPHREAAYWLGLILVGTWWILLGGTFAYVAFNDPLANPLGAVHWTVTGVLYWLWAWFEYKRIR